MLLLPLSDIIKIARREVWPDVNIAPQVLISCSGDDGCHGGEAFKGFEWMNKNEFTDATCVSTVASYHDTGENGS